MMWLVLLHILVAFRFSSLDKPEAIGIFSIPQVIQGSY